MLEIKRGDTFSFYANISDEAGDPLVTDAANITSQIRDTMYQLVANLTVAATATPGKYLFTAATTADWPSEVWGAVKLLMDIQMDIAGTTVSSDTVEIFVVKDVTNNE